jgi:neutral ceramidase
MQVMNFSSSEVTVFLYNRADLATLFARVEMTLSAGANGSISHPTDSPCKLGIKFGGFGRFGNFIVPPSGQTYADDADLILNADFSLVHRNAPSIPAPTPSLTPAQRDRDLVPPPKPTYFIGVGIAKVSDPACDDEASALPMQGWANSKQKTEGRKQLPKAESEVSELFARAFIVADPLTQERVVMVVADIWSCSIAIKQEVCRRLLTGSEKRRYRLDNIWIAGTHTHSGPGGYLHHLLYNAMGGGFDPHVFECIVSGIVRAIDLAHESLSPGMVFSVIGSLENVGRNRSIDAYNRNPLLERNSYQAPTDTDIQLLKFVKKIGKFDVPVGLLCWYPLHPTNRGQDCTIVNGDNKGWAAFLAEQELAQRLRKLRLPGKSLRVVAAFANSNCGDVSGNLTETGQTPELLPDIGSSVIDSTGVSFYPSAWHDPSATNTLEASLARNVAKMRHYGKLQSDAAIAAFDRAANQLDIHLASVHKFVDFPKRTALAGSLGISMAAGSQEDGVSGMPFDEGIVETDPANLGQTNSGPLSNLISGATLLFNKMDRMVTGLMSPLTRTPLLQALTNARNAGTAERLGQFPKPVLLMTGAVRPTPLTPNILPIQVIQIGTFALLGIPGEITTMAGRRLREQTLKNLEGAHTQIVALGTYANGYSQYISTKEEYNAQHYEGASTLFGPQTLETYQTAFSELTHAIVQNTPAQDDAPCPDLTGSVLTKRRMTFRNDSPNPVRFRFYLVEDEDYSILLFGEADFEVQPDAERAIVLPLWLSYLTHVQIVVGDDPLPSKSGPTNKLFPMTLDLVHVSKTGVSISGTYVAKQRDL